MPDRSQPFPVTRVGGVQHITFGQHADGHWAFTLAINLRKVRADDLQCLFDVGQVHGAAAIDDGGQTLRPLRQVARRIHQPPHHGGRCKKRGPLPVRSQQQGFMRVKPVRARHHIQPGVQHIRQVVHAAAVRQRRRV